MHMLKDPEKLILSAKGKFMSNAKWRKLISLVEESGLIITESQWKWLGDSKVYVKASFPKLAYTNETGFKDGVWSPNYFKYIYRVLIPRVCESPRDDTKKPMPCIHQPVDELYELILQAGEFPVYQTECGLEIRAYAL